MPTLRLAPRGELTAVVPASNWTDDEFIAFMRDKYPDMCGDFQELLKRFEQITSKGAHVLVDDLPLPVNCPCCGAQLDILLETT